MQLDGIAPANAPGTCNSKVLIALDEAAAVVAVGKGRCVNQSIMRLLDWKILLDYGRSF